MTGLQPPRVTERPVPVFTGAELLRLESACAGRTFAQRRDAAVIAVFRATGIRLAELAGIRYDPGDLRRSDVDLWQREITVCGKGGRARIVKIGYGTARSLDRYLRIRARHAQAFRAQLWLGVNDRGPMTASGIYQMIARRGRQCGVDVYPHRFRHHFSHTWLDQGGAEGDLMELNGWTSPQMLRRYGASARSARARRSYDRINRQALEQISAASSPSPTIPTATDGQPSPDNRATSPRLRPTLRAATASRPQTCVGRAGRTSARSRNRLAPSNCSHRAFKRSSSRRENGRSSVPVVRFNEPGQDLGEQRS
ncbi:MAG TPA: site-specific integrase [Streptosporangiaceae bacterium]|nr:site-specific integrase [Streptosporangiaceae bacterium]